jgi:hypothetical protein
MHSLRTALAAVAAGIAFMSSAVAAPSCATVGEAPSVELVAAHPTATEEVTATREEMDHLADRLGVSPAMRKAHPLMLAVGEGGTHVEMVHRIIERRDVRGAAYVCDVPGPLKVVIGAFTRRVILIGKPLPIAAFVRRCWIIWRSIARCLMRTLICSSTSTGTGSRGRFKR